MCAVYGGSSKWEQTQDLKQGAEIVVATPVSNVFIMSKLP